MQLNIPLVFDTLDEFDNNNNELDTYMKKEHENIYNKLMLEQIDKDNIKMYIDFLKNKCNIVINNTINPTVGIGSVAVEVTNIPLSVPFVKSRGPRGVAIGTAASKGVKEQKAVAQVTTINLNEVILTHNNFRELLKYDKVNLIFLKKNIKRLSLGGISGNKLELFNKLFSHFYYFNYIVKIQALFRGYLNRKLFKLQSLNNKKKCTNTMDFITLEDTNTIPNDYFYSYSIKHSNQNNEQYEDVYGFNITSIYINLIKKKDIKNPFTRVLFPDFVKKEVEEFVRLSKVLNKKLNLVMEDDTKNLSIEKKMNFQALELFQSINELNNYSDAKWFLQLSKSNTFRFIKELHDIWEYRAGLSHETKCEYYPPNGDLFSNININIKNFNSEPDIIKMKSKIISILSKFINADTSLENKKTNAMFILSALTLVCPVAAEAMPHYYFGVLYN